MKNKGLGQILNRFFPKKKQIEVETPDFSKQMPYSLAIHSSLFANNPLMSELLHKYSVSIDLSIKDGIETFKDQLGDKPFEKHAYAGVIFCNTADKNNTAYIMLGYNIFFNNNEYSKYVIEMLELKNVSVDEYLDYYNEGLKCGLIAKSNNQ